MAVAGIDHVRSGDVFKAVPRRDFTLRRLLAVSDAVAIAAGLAAATLLAADVSGGERQLLWGLALLPAWTLLFKIYGLYDRDGKRVSHSTVDDAPWLFHALIVGSLGLWLFTKVAPVPRLTLTEGLTFFVVTFAGLFVARGAARAIARIAIQAERVLFVGGGSMARLLVAKIKHHPEYGLCPVGFVDHERETEGDATFRHLGGIAELESVCRLHAIERLIIVSQEIEEEQLVDTIRVATGLDLRISIIPHLVEVLGPSVEIDDVEGITVLGLNPPELTPSSRMLKRAMDLGIASIALILSLPLMALVAVLVKATSAGPVFYSQERIGRRDKRFKIHKFRTMVADAERREQELWKRSTHSTWLLLDHDPRITPVGRVLRRASLDELPQLWNVVKGDMSLVGPRPMPPSVDSQILGWGRRRLDLTPGITGLWQVLGRVNIPFEEMVKLDYLYVTNWSLWQDTRLLIHTLPAVLRRRGAN